MKNRISFLDLIEQENFQPEVEVPQPPQVQQFKDTQPPMQMQQVAELPQNAQSVEIDPMVMTVGDFINKIKQFDPLVSMGLESFIEKNKELFKEEIQPQVNLQTGEPELNFSNVVAQTQVQPFSLDQSPDALNFPAQ
jgi:hypothetical protein